ncbi:MAG: sulfatase-like hydrolase/transferase, partial [Verrucomicrobiota bacterium]|nr:sulfatase-like hydrolase/transferase [Verrucomicrobiota bacterium]
MISRPGTHLPGVLTVLLLMGQPMVHGADGPPATGKPNIVLILADDVSADMFSCYGRPGSARTPNIDRIAREGVRFRTCYAPAICGPS